MVFMRYFVTYDIREEANVILKPCATGCQCKTERWKRNNRSQCLSLTITRFRQFAGILQNSAQGNYKRTRSISQRLAVLHNETSKKTLPIVAKENVMSEIRFPLKNYDQELFIIRRDFDCRDFDQSTSSQESELLAKWLQFSSPRVKSAAYSVN